MAKATFLSIATNPNEPKEKWPKLTIAQLESWLRGGTVHRSTTAPAPSPAAPSPAAAGDPTEAVAGGRWRRGARALAAAAAFMPPLKSELPEAADAPSPAVAQAAGDSGDGGDGGAGGAGGADSGRMGRRKLRGASYAVMAAKGRTDASERGSARTKGAARTGSPRGHPLQSHGVGRSPPSPSSPRPQTSPPRLMIDTAGCSVAQETLRSPIFRELLTRSLCGGGSGGRGGELLTRSLYGGGNGGRGGVGDARNGASGAGDGVRGVGDGIDEASERGVRPKSREASGGQPLRLSPPPSRSAYAHAYDALATREPHQTPPTARRAAPRPWSPLSAHRFDMATVLREHSGFWSSRLVRDISDRPSQLSTQLPSPSPNSLLAPRPPTAPTMRAPSSRPQSRLGDGSSLRPQSIPHPRHGGASSRHAPSRVGCASPRLHARLVQSARNQLMLGMRSHAAAAGQWAAVSHWQAGWAVPYASVQTAGDQVRQVSDKLQKP